MKHLFIYVFCLLTCIILKAQSSKDTTIAFKVFGNCSQCKARIENALKLKGINHSVWNIDTKILEVDYKPSIISIEKIHETIVSAGHDTELKKATTKAYQLLPSCCLYREAEGSNNKMLPPLKGIVVELDKKGNFVPLSSASVYWLNKTVGTLTNANGIFSIPPDTSTNKIVISYTGFKSDTISFNNDQILRVILASGDKLEDVTVKSNRQSMFVSTISAVRTIEFGERELVKAACCNLGESFETNPSVDVSFTDAVTGSKQIQLLGLSGIYTQLTVENMPGPHGLATLTGLNYIPGTWIESIQLTKGTGSVVNGFESIAGQINIEEIKTLTSEKLYANAFVNEFGKTDINLNLTTQIGSRWSTALLVHNDFLLNKSIDKNGDGFRDLPYGNLFTALNRWKYNNNKGLMIQFGINVLSDFKTGGQVGFDPSIDKFTTKSYGVGLETARYGVFGKIGYSFPGKKYKSIGIQFSGFDHHQNDYFGLNGYNGIQHNIYGNIIYQSIIGNMANRFRTGFSFLSDVFNENVNIKNYYRREIVPGAFFEYTYIPSGKFTIVTGLRVDQHNLFGFFVTPRINARYQLGPKTTIRISGGRGQRTANVFAENTSMFASSRSIDMPTEYAGNHYGFKPEIAWNNGLSIDQKITIGDRQALFSADYFRTDFQNQVVADMDQSARIIQFYNLKGTSYSNSFQTDFNYELFKKFNIRLAYRWLDVKTNFHGTLMEKPFVAKDRVLAGFDCETKRKWTFDLNVLWTSPKRIPYTGDNPGNFRLSNYSTSFIMVNMQVTKKAGAFEFYTGAENLTNFMQKNLIIDPSHPFGNYFDASMVWGPAMGRMLYGGIRYKLK